MPQRLENARESLMRYGKEFLLSNTEGEAGKLNVRDLTAQCGMALGTFYHYFSSKDDLVCQIIMEDWQKSLNLIHSNILSDRSFYKKLKFVYMQVCDFEQTYRSSALNLLGRTEENQRFMTECFGSLQNEIADFLSGEIEKRELSLEADPDMAAYLLTDVIIAAAGNPAMDFDNLWKCLCFKYKGSHTN